MTTVRITDEWGTADSANFAVRGIGPVAIHTIHHERADTYRAAFEKNDNGMRVSNAPDNWRSNPAEHWRKICDETDGLESANKRYGYRKYAEKRIAGMTHEEAMAWLHEHGVWQWR